MVCVSALAVLPNSSFARATSSPVRGVSESFCFFALDIPPPSPHRASQAAGKGAHVRAQGWASSRRPADAEKRRAPSVRSARGAVSGAASFGYFSSLVKKSNPLAAGEWKLWLFKAKDQK